MTFNGLSLVVVALMASSLSWAQNTATPATTPPGGAPAAPAPAPTEEIPSVISESSEGSTGGTAPIAVPVPAPATKPKAAAPPVTKPGQRIIKNTIVVIELESEGKPLGTVKAVLYPDKVPKTFASFVGLVEGTRPFTEFDSTKGAKGQEVTRPFYEDLLIHRVVPDNLIQGGCPLGNGKGGPGWGTPEEIRGDLRFDQPGVLAMASSNKKSGSQFFITLKPLKFLDGKFTIIGKVVSGLEIVKNVSLVKRNPITEKPTDPIIIKKMSIVREYAN